MVDVRWKMEQYTNARMKICKYTSGKCLFRYALTSLGLLNNRTLKGG